MPLGAPGAIVFSGICVGRGYVNDAGAHPAQAYLTDPHRPGQRLYRAGDYGRWRPDGKLEFLGRRDSQVKISGFRIEIGEIENTLLRVPGVRDGAVVVAERAGHSRHLVAFYSGPRPLELDAAAGAAGRVAARVHGPDGVPLAAQPAADRQQQDRQEGARPPWPATLDVVEDGHEPPAHRPSSRLAAAWARCSASSRRSDRPARPLLRPGRHLPARRSRLAIAWTRAVSLKDITCHPVLADLAALIDAPVPDADRTIESGIADMSTCVTDRMSSALRSGTRTQPGRPAMLRSRPPADAASWAGAAPRRRCATAVVAHGSVLVRGLALRDAGRRRPPCSRPSARAG